MDASKALALAPPGSRLLKDVVRFEVRPDIYVDSVVVETRDSMIVVYDGKLPDGGFARGTLEVDKATYQKALEFGQRIGGRPMIKALLEKAAGDTLDIRRTLPR